MSHLRLVHLSDIHFSYKEPEFGFSPDEDLRVELGRDLQRELGKLQGGAAAILVSGDVAYSGKKKEYDIASQWLDEVCKTAGAKSDAVYACPGNHDVDRDVLRDNSLIQDAQDAVRSKATDFERNSTLNKRLTEPVARTLFYAATQAFNDFAAGYECSFFADEESYAWDRDLNLNDGSKLRIRGLNSALFSGPNDSEKSLFLGDRAYTMHRHSGVEYLSLCHHPPNWLLDGREAERALDDRARIELFGHEHDARISPGRDEIKLFAGAVNPHRAEPNWRPGYNILDIWIETNAGERRMVVEVRAREWQRQKPTQFRAYEDRDNNPVHRTEFKLDAWTPLPVVQEVAMEPSASGADVGQDVAGGQKSMSRRELINRFFRLSTSRKNEILGRLKLLDDAQDRILPEVERFKRALLRARDTDKLGELESLVAESK